MHRRRRGYRPVSRRRREERRRTVKRRALIAAGVLLLAGMAMAQPLRESLLSAVRRAVDAVQAAALSSSAQAQVTLPRRTVYALQLGAYDNGKHAQDELVRLSEEGVLSVIWQREQMRLVCDASESKGKLEVDAAGGRDAWVISEEMPEVALRVSAGAASLDAVRSLLLLPDALFLKLCVGEKPLGETVAYAREAALPAQSAYPDNALYTQLAQSLVNWCNLMAGTIESHGEAAAKSYARVTMCTLCRELRLALTGQSEASTASAQRTPSTAAEVMPPA